MIQFFFILMNQPRENQAVFVDEQNNVVPAAFHIHRQNFENCSQSSGSNSGGRDL